MEPGTLAPVAARTKVWDIKRRVPRPERVKASLAIVEGDRSKADPTEWTFAKEIVMLDALLKKEPAAEVEVQVVQVGPAVFVSDPAEYFCEYGLEIKAASGFPFTFPVSLANGCVGYVPTERRLRRRRRRLRDPADELQQPRDHRRQPDARRRDRAGEEPQAGRSPPSRPAIPPSSGKPWAYGNVPPERD